MLHRWLTRLWYGGGLLAYLLWPLSLLFQGLVSWRRQQYLAHRRTVYQAPVPVIVVGNISVGGTGKSPLVIWLVEQLLEHGYSPGVVSRGYGGNAPSYPHRIKNEDGAREVGDEPLMIHLRTGVPVVVDPNRSAAVKYLLKHTNVDVVISDDGLQHYGLGRTLEIAVIDGVRGLGNGLLLPAGPLREPQKRLQEVDIIVTHGKSDLSISEQVKRFVMNVEAGAPQPLNAVSSALMNGRDLGVCYAVTGIGNPQRFFQTLSGFSYDYKPHVFPDHHQYTAADLKPFMDGFVLTTEKDAVKLRSFEAIKGAYIPISARLQDGLIDVILKRLQAFKTQPQYRY